MSYSFNIKQAHSKSEVEALAAAQLDGLISAPDQDPDNRCRHALLKHTRSQILSHLKASLKHLPEPNQFQAINATLYGHVAEKRDEIISPDPHEPPTLTDPYICSVEIACNVALVTR